SYGATRGDRPNEQGDRARARRDGPHGRGSSFAGVCQARHHVPRPARGTNRGRRPQTLRVPDIAAVVPEAYRRYRMSEYLLEFYVARDDDRGASDGGESVRVAAEELTRRGSAIHVRWSMFVPDEETCFVLFEAESPEAVSDAAVLANLPPVRINAIRRPP